jgi:RimJ/RimL family protein N-acetyltransferase
VRLETERLLLRAPEAEDIDAFAEMYADPEATRFIGGVRSREQVTRWLAERRAAFARQGYGMCAVVERSSDRVIGRCGLVHWEIEGADELEVGYAFARPFWGNGYGTEAAAAVRDYAVAKLRRARLISLIDPENERSVRVAEKLGMAHEREVEFHGKLVRLYALTAPPHSKT